ncbi:MAG: hypothetical protein N4A64_00875, partial [Marinisporobacter sp.]|nr:hypothetical protein [Marinisporobacter sp.]
DQLVKGKDDSYTVTLNDGPNKITVEATDQAGNQAEKQFTIVYKKIGNDTTAPIILTDLENRTVSEAVYTFTVTANDDVDGKIIPIVKMNDQLVKGKDDSYTVTLNDGPNKITVEATDQAGNQAEKQFTMVYKKMGTQFEIERIGNDIYRNGDDARIIIKGKNIDDEDKEATFIVALYDKDNRMINYSFISRVIKSKEVVEMSGGFLIPQQGSYKIKGFVWDNMDDMNVLSKKIIEIAVKE